MFLQANPSHTRSVGLKDFAHHVDRNAKMPFPFSHHTLFRIALFGTGLTSNGGFIAQLL